MTVDATGRIHDSFARQGLMALLGAEVIEVAPGRCVVAVAYRPDLAQQHGLFHGAVVGAIADVAGGYAALTLAPEESEVLTVEYKLSLYAPARGASLRAEGQVLRAGRLTTCLITVIDVAADGTERPCATALQTIATIRPPAGGTPTPAIVTAPPLPAGQ